MLYSKQNENNNNIYKVEMRKMDNVYGSYVFIYYQMISVLKLVIL